MAYFSNGTEARDYQQRYCFRCVHCVEGHGCPCWDAHELWAYEECNKPDSILHKMIPQTKDGLGNEQCTFFVEASDG